MLKTFLAGLLAIFCGGALADGATFITAGPPLADTAFQRRLLAFHKQDAVQLHAVTINRGVFGSPILTVDMGKYHFRFVGTMMKPLPDGTQAWSGADPGGTLLSLTKEPKSGDVYGQMVTAEHDFDVMSTTKRGSWVLELDRSKGAGTVPYVPYVTPGAASAAAAKRGTK